MNKERPVIGFVSASLDMITWVRNQFDHLFPFFEKHKHVHRTPKSATLHKSKKHNYHSFTITGIRAARIIHELRKIPVPKFPRKWENPEILARLEEYKQKYPEFFN